jgi:crotonobetainyl-CoA:carnitine CoA-transferase CaiB-like acyl-CoA transferase
VPKPLDGIRVLEVAQWTFVPAAGAVLADWGADVLKVEHPRFGDAQRGLKQLGTVVVDGSVNPLMEHANRGKRSIGVDITSPEGLAVLLDLARTSDVFLTNFLPHTLEKLGLGVEDLRAVNPQVVYARGSAYGSAGPDGASGGFDMTGFWSRGGSASGARPSDLDGVVSQPGPAYGDSIGAATFAGGISAALLQRERTGEAPVVETSLLAVGAWAMGLAIDLALLSGEPWSASPSGYPVAPTNPLTGVYRTSDDRALALSVMQATRYWAELCELLDLPGLATDERFATAGELSAHATEAAEILRDVFAARPLSEWREVLAPFSGQWAVMQDTVEVGRDPQMRANGMIVEIDAPDGPFEVVSSPIRFDDTAFDLERAPEFAEHTEAVLLEIDRSWEQILALKEAGIVA